MSERADVKALSHAYLEWLLAHRDEEDVRPALRRGAHESLDSDAYRLLGKFWQGAYWLRRPILLHAATATLYPMRDGDDSLGRMFGRIATTHNGDGGSLDERMILGRLASVQRMSLAVASRMLGSLLAEGTALAYTVSWEKVLDLFVGWDHPDPRRRHRARRSLLEDCLARPAPAAKPS